MPTTDEILTAAGIAHRRARYTRPPAGTYAVYFDHSTTDGPDRLEGTNNPAARVVRVDAEVELYEDAPDDTAEAALAEALTARGIDYEKDDRVWIDSEQLYMAVFSFTYYNKRR